MEAPLAQGRARAVDRRFATVLAVLVGVRLAIPLVVLAASGEGLPGLPVYRYRPLNGDAEGFYAAAREFLSAIGRVARPQLLLATLVVAVAFVGAVLLWRRRPELRWVALLLPVAAVSLALVLPIRQMSPPGAAVFGWPLLWSLPMIPLRAVGHLDPDVAFVLGLVLTLGALAVGVVATAYVGLYATGRRAVGLWAAGIFSAWPLLSGQLAGHSAWQNGQWNVDVGLHLYTEPLSTALVVASVALLLRPQPGSLGLAGSGLLTGYATVVKLTNGVVGVVLALLVARRHGVRAAVPYAIGALVLAPVALAYWPKGYVGMFDGATAAVPHPWRLSYARDNWADSLLFTPRLLLLLLPLAVLGCVAIRLRWELAVLLTPIVVNAVVYSFYYVTAEHPRFLYAALPFLFVLEAAGGVWLFERLLRRPQQEVRVL